MKNKGIFIKVFTYTIISILLIVSITITLFSQQFISFYRTMQNKQIIASYEPLIKQVKRNNNKDIAKLAESFYKNNQSFGFYIVDRDGKSIYSTPNTNDSNNIKKDFFFIVHNDKYFSIIAQRRTGLESFYQDLIVRGITVIIAIFMLCLICALFFARQITKPIKALADNTNKMANLEEVLPLPNRRDELGSLSNDVYSMYDKLKKTISKLEYEILKQRELEETQRYFFSAASHELKTPISATSILLEGMLENIGDYKNHPKYLRECLKMMDSQSKLISEMLEIVSLSTRKIIPLPVKLNIQYLLRDILSDFQTLLESNNQSIIINVPDNQICFADSKMLKKALSNIILNAIQNTPKDGKIHIWIDNISGNHHLCILNLGVNIEKTILAKLFDPFYHIDTSRSSKNRRSGLGLTIVKKTLEAMKIDFSLENTKDGVLFWLNLPKQ